MNEPSASFGELAEKSLLRTENLAIAVLATGESALHPVDAVIETLTDRDSRLQSPANLSDVRTTHYYGMEGRVCD
jgi:hypothetical protein